MKCHISAFDTSKHCRATGEVVVIPHVDSCNLMAVITTHIAKRQVYCQQHSHAVKQQQNRGYTNKVYIQVNVAHLV